jgi:hypothetical protein
MANIIISKRLYTVMPTGITEVKLNSITYNTRFKLTIEDDTDKDYIMAMEAAEFNFFCFNKDSKITCWPTSKGTQPLGENGSWKKEGRQEIKAGRFLLQFSDYFRVTEDGYIVDNQDIRNKVIARLCEIFGDSLRASNAPLTFDISDDIAKVYGTTEHEASGYLQSSCMRPGSGYSCRYYAEFYNLIPGCKVLYKKSLNGNLLFRALLWTAKDSNGNDVTFLDRIYGSDATNIALIEHAKSQGWAYRTFSGWRIIKDDTTINVEMAIPDKAYEYLEENGAPYMDSLPALSEESNGWTLSNYHSSDYTLQDCGGRAVNSRVTCDHCGDRIDENEAHYINDETLCSSCLEAAYVYCSNCGEYTSNDDAIITEDSSYCLRCANRLGIHECELCHEYTSDAISHDDGCVYCEDCFNDNFRYCDICNDYHAYDDVEEIRVDGSWNMVCEDCKRDLHYCLKCEEYFTDELNNLDLCEDCNSNIWNQIEMIERQMEMETV